MRSQNPPQQQSPHGTRHDEGASDYHREEDRRPRSSHAKPESQFSPTTDKVQPMRRSVPPDLGPRRERDVQPSQVTPTSNDAKLKTEDNDVEMGGMDKAQSSPKESKEKPNLVAVVATKEPPPQQPAPNTAAKKPLLRVPVVRFSLPPKDATPPSETWESDDEDMGDYFADELTKTETALRELEKKGAPWDVATRFASLSHDMALKIAVEDDQVYASLRPIPTDLEAKAYVSPTQGTQPSRTESTKPPTSDNSAPPKAAKPDAEVATTVNPIPQPKTEEMDISVPEPPAEVAVKQEAQPGSEDVLMADAPPAPETATVKDGNALPLPEQNGVITEPRPPVDGLPAGQSSDDGSRLPTPPSQVEDDGDETESDDPEAMILDSLRQTMKTPPIDSLPNFRCKPWDKDSKLLRALEESDTPIEEFITDQLEKSGLERLSEQREVGKVYLQNYRSYLDFTLSADPVALKVRDKVYGTSTAAETLAAAQASVEQKPEGRGGGRRFATERDLERVIQASIKEDEERRQREIQLQKEKHRSEKESIILPMYWDEKQMQDELFYDNSGFVPVDRLASAWECLPPIVNFTEEEAEQFEKRYMDKPKQWGVIAEAIPKRDFKACIQFYYLKKKPLNLKEKLKKQPKRRKKSGRGKQRSSALVSELGNGENETEENNAEGGEGGERRRPRRAAAPTFSFEQNNNAADSDGVASGSGRRANAGGSKVNADGEKVDGRKGRRKVAKDKEAKAAAKANQTLAATPTPGPGRGRSRSNSRAQNPETPAPAGAAEPPRLPITYEQPATPQPPPAVEPVPQAPPPPTPTLEHPPPATQTSSMADVMAPPAALAPPQLRPDPPPPPPAHATPLTFVQTPSQPSSERRAPSQASSYWSVSEITEFPALLRAFGTDWGAIANHMGSKTPVMV